MQFGYLINMCNIKGNLFINGLNMYIVHVFFNLNFHFWMLYMYYHYHCHYCSKDDLCRVFLKESMDSLPYVIYFVGLGGIECHLVMRSFMIGNNI